MRMKNSCTNCFKNLGVGSRLKIYSFLEDDKPKNVSQITQFVGLRQPTVSYHLSEMQKAGLLTKKSQGKESYYSINKKCPHDGKRCIVSSE